MNHSPLPWRTSSASTHVEGDPFWSTRVSASHGGISATGVAESEPGARANAAFIVRACNSHDELVAALEEARAAITAVNRGAGETVFNPAATQLVDAALKLARGEA